MLPHSRITPLRSVTAAAIALALVGTLTACSPDAAAPEPDDIPTAAPGETPTASDDPAPEPVKSETPAPPFDEVVRDAIASGHTAVLEDYFVTPTRIVIAASESDGMYEPVDAVIALDYVRPGLGTWNWDVSDATLAHYRESEFYGAFFPDDVIVGISSDGPVIAISPNGELIATVLMAAGEELLFF